MILLFTKKYVLAYYYLAEMLIMDCIITVVKRVFNGNVRVFESPFILIPYSLHWHFCSKNSNNTYDRCQSSLMIGTGRNLCFGEKQAEDRNLLLFNLPLIAFSGYTNTIFYCSTMNVTGVTAHGNSSLSASVVIFTERVCSPAFIPSTLY